MSNKGADYLIVGGGIAGVTLALQLLESGKSITMYDAAAPSAASRVAAGIMNPVTGQRFVKSWMFDDLMIAASTFYQRYDNIWGTSFFSSIHIQRALFKKNEVSNYEMRELDKHYSQHFSIDDPATEKKHFEAVEAWCTVRGARLHIGKFVERAKTYLVEMGMQLVEEKIEYSKLEFGKDGIKYQNSTYKKVTCCEGMGIIQNPFFNHLPMVPAKGECLLIEIPQLEAKDIYKHKVFIVPNWEKNLFWVGSNYDWDFTTALPTEKGKAWLVKKLEASLKVPYKIKAHIAAIRPTGKDRRPYLGEHAEHKNLYVFNALGTKGSSLAPYCAGSLIKFMEDGEDLDKEVSIERFS